MAPPVKRRPTTIPTPDTGYPLVWHEWGNEKYTFPARVIEQEGVGTIALSYLKGGVERTVRGVKYSKHPDFKDGEHPNKKLYGTWDYIKGFEIPKSHNEYHENQLAAFERNQRVAKERQEQEHKEYQEMLKEQSDPQAVATAHKRAMALSQQG